MLVKTPKKIHNCVKPIQYFCSARIAFQNILKFLNFTDEEKILLPAYIGITDREGSGVFDPIQNLQLTYEFYTLDNKLRALKSELYELIKSEKYKALLVIHYFGFCQNDMEKIVHLCQVHNVLLIEDCAHTMLSDIPLGQLGKLGDFSFYSVHKFLATKDGGCLRVNNHKYQHLLSSNDGSRPEIGTLDMLSRADLNVIREKRRLNYIYLIALMNDVPGIKIMYPELPEGIAPHNFPFLVLGGKRESVYFNLIKKGVPVIALYYRMINPILNGEYHNASYVSQNILNFPIHQDINVDDLEFMVQQLKQLVTA